MRARSRGIGDEQHVARMRRERFCSACLELDDAGEHDDELGNGRRVQLFGRLRGQSPHFWRRRAVRRFAWR
jgi:hypothetical protein